MTSVANDNLPTRTAVRSGRFEIAGFAVALVCAPCTLAIAAVFLALLTPLSLAFARAVLAQAGWAAAPAGVAWPAGTAALLAAMYGLLRATEPVAFRLVDAVADLFGAREGGFLAIMMAVTFAGFVFCVAAPLVAAAFATYALAT